MIRIDPPPLHLAPAPVKPERDEAGGPRARKEPSLPVPVSGLPATVPGEPRKNETEAVRGPSIPGVDVRSITPRAMADLSLDLYANGILTWEEHEMLSFQPELNPAYNDTVGALTGEAADPDRPRDFLEHWENRLTFERKYNPENRESLRVTRQIVAVLRRLASPINITA